jgi:hypothetical protein
MADCLIKLKDFDFIAQKLKPETEKEIKQRQIREREEGKKREEHTADLAQFLESNDYLAESMRKFFKEDDYRKKDKRLRMKS